MSLKVTKENITDVLKEGITVLDFWAQWCGPCRILGPVIDELAVENAGSVNIGKVNVDTDGEISSKFGIRGIPTLIFFKNGVEVNRVSGVQTKSSIQEKINALK